MKVYKNILLGGVAAILVFAPAARGAVRVWSMTPIMLLLISLVLTWLIRANNKKRYIFRKTALDRPISIFFILAGISAVFSVYPYASFHAILKLCCYIGLYYLVVNEFSGRMTKVLLAIAVSVGTVLSALGLLQWAGLLGHSWWIPREFLASTYVNHNHFAGYLELAMPLGVSLLISRRTSHVFKNILLIAALVIMGAAFVLTQSRGAWASFGIALLVMVTVLLTRRGRDNKAAFILVLVIAAVFSFAYLSKDLVSQRIDTMADIDTPGEFLDVRARIWLGTLAMIGNSPLVGSGIGTFIWAFSRFRPADLSVQANFAHNDYLQTAAEMGVVSALVMAWIFALLVAKGLRKDASSASFGCAIGILSLALHGLIDFNFHIPANMILFVVCAAIVAGDNAAD
jgi:O-antigen ligase